MEKEKCVKVTKTTSFATFAKETVDVNDSVFKQAVRDYEAANPAVKIDPAWNAYVTKECLFRGLNG